MTANASLLGADVYNIMVCGKESFASVSQDGFSAQFIYLPPVYSGPLMPNSSVGFKFGECPKILNDQWVFRLRVTLA